MVQHKMKKKVTLPSGVKQKTKMKSTKKQEPKRGHQITIAPKRASAVQQAKINAEITRTINKKNEELLQGRADKEIGKSNATISRSKKKK